MSRDRVVAGALLLFGLGGALEARRLTIGDPIAAHHFLPSPSLATTFFTASCSLSTSFAVAAGFR